MSDALKSLDLAASGMQAAARAQEASARRVANLNTVGSQAMDREFVEANPGVVVLFSDEAVDAAREATATEDALRTKDQEVSLEREMVQQVRNQAVFDANAAVVRTADEMIGTLLDTQG